MFFCSEFKLNCELFRLAKKTNYPIEYKTLYNNGFIICPECSSKGKEYLEIAFKRWIKNPERQILKIKEGVNK